MALVETKQIELGFTAPHFSLPDTVSDKTLSINRLKGRLGTVVMFICNHCPYVIHIREKLIQIANQYQAKGISFIAISANDIEKYPEDSPIKMKELADSMNFPFPYLYDESQDVAKAYFAECTPDFSLFDKDLKCVYRGRLDDSTPGNGIPVTGNDLKKVLDNLVENVPYSGEQYPSMGCSIKWK